MKKKERIKREDQKRMTAGYNITKNKFQIPKSLFKTEFRILAVQFPLLTFINLISTLLNPVYNFIRIFSYLIPVLRLTQDDREKLTGI